MDEAKAKELIGKKILISLSEFDDATIYRAEIKSISPSGKFIEIQIEEDKPYWRRLSENIYFLEELPVPEPLIRMPIFTLPPPPEPPLPRVFDSSYTEAQEKVLKGFRIFNTIFKRKSNG